MNKTELIAAMAEASGLTKKDCDTALNAFVDTLQTALTVSYTHLTLPTKRIV